MIVKRIKTLKGTVRPHPDRLQAAVSVILAALAEGESEISPWPGHGDFVRLLKWLDLAGVAFRLEGETLFVEGRGLFVPKETDATIPVCTCAEANALCAAWFTAAPGRRARFGGRAIRLRKTKTALAALPGLSCSEDGETLAVERTEGIGDEEEILARSAPGDRSAKMLCALLAGKTFLRREPFAAQDAFPRALQAFGAPLEVREVGLQALTEIQRRALRRSKMRPERHVTWFLSATARLEPQKIELFADPGLGALLALLASQLPDSSLEIEQVSVTPSRCGFFSALGRYGAVVKRAKERSRGGETAATIQIATAKAFGCGKAGDVHFSPEQCACVGEDLPLLMAAATFADGESVFRLSGNRRPRDDEARSLLLDDLRRCSADVGEFDGGVVVRGHETPDADAFSSDGDAPLSLACAALACTAKGQSDLDDRTLDALEELWPGWHSTLEALNDG